MVNNLIFLGQIPGTNFQITFTDVIDLCMVVVVLLLCRKLYELRHQIVDFFLQNPEVSHFTQAARATGRINSVLPVNSGPDQLDLFAYQAPQGV